MGRNRYPGILQWFCMFLHLFALQDGRCLPARRPHFASGTWEFSAIPRAQPAYRVAPRKHNKPPTTELATPPISSHMALSVGEPVKSREKSEPIELDDCAPKMMRTMPMATRAIPRTLFIICLSHADCSRPPRLTPVADSGLRSALIASRMPSCAARSEPLMPVSWAHFAGSAGIPPQIAEL